MIEYGDNELQESRVRKYIDSLTEQLTTNAAAEFHPPGVYQMSVNLLKELSFLPSSCQTFDYLQNVTGGQSTYGLNVAKLLGCLISCKNKRAEMPSEKWTDGYAQVLPSLEVILKRKVMSRGEPVVFLDALLTMVKKEPTIPAREAIALSAERDSFITHLQRFTPVITIEAPKPQIPHQSFQAQFMQARTKKTLEGVSSTLSQFPLGLSAPPTVRADTKVPKYMLSRRLVQALSPYKNKRPRSASVTLDIENTPLKTMLRVETPLKVTPPPTPRLFPSPSANGVIIPATPSPAKSHLPDFLSEHPASYQRDCFTFSIFASAPSTPIPLEKSSAKFVPQSPNN
eukprot:GILI01013841.1.p1 GENE.GILI01013841.1~~GILI01013841.1.p1  ORF type:complete len:342 (+),score=15.26 GILI01013841.1:31-1056(+)